MMKQFHGDSSPANVTFRHSPFWIHIFNIPIKSMNKAIGTRIGNEMEELLMVDAPKSGLAWGPFLRIRAKLPTTVVMINPRQSMPFGTLPGKDNYSSAKQEVGSYFQMDKVVKITEIASNSNSDDVILVQNHDKPNCFLPLDRAASNLDTNLNCDDKTIIPRELEHCDNAEIHNIDFFESSSNTKSTHHNWI
uniref:DUF4283 domain-containing protein n=1 Tax=Quercus lobata TaxID=97700 RepID=A0A7N2LKA4_QUELO